MRSWRSSGILQVKHHKKPDFSESGFFVVIYLIISGFTGC